jgi:hypothetical protein
MVAPKEQAITETEKIMHFPKQDIILIQSLDLFILCVHISISGGSFFWSGGNYQPGLYRGINLRIQ